MRNGRANVFDVKLRAAGGRPASSGAPLAAHPIMPVQVARRRANSRRGSRLGRREKPRRTVNFNDELGCALCNSSECLLYRHWQRHANEIVFWIKVVLAGFIDHANHTVLL